MGADLEDNEAEVRESPLRKIYLSTFAIQRTPVTVGLWKTFLQATAYNWDFHDEVNEVSSDDLSPISYVSWFDCYQFTEWLKETFNQPYALSTEAQWEKACRGEKGQLYPWGNEEPEEWQTIPAYSETTLPVGSCPKERQSFYGCLDMWQNVSEWCFDWYDEELYDYDDGQYYQNDPTKTTNPTGPITKKYKIHRGGSSMWDSGWPRCSYRAFNKPDFRHPRLGFRVVLNL